MKAVRLLKIPPVQNPTLSVMEDIVREEKPPYQLTEKNAFLASARKSFRPSEKWAGRCEIDVLVAWPRELYERVQSN